MDSPSAPAIAGSRSWSIYGRTDITQRYEILGRVGSGAYADVYRGRRRSDGLEVALKEIHDYQSAGREIDALQSLRGAPNVVDIVEYFWVDGEDAVVVLEFLPVDLEAVIRDAKRSGRGIRVGEVKQWMLQILRGVEACHRCSVAHRDLKPSNLLISSDGVLKLADFGQSRMMLQGTHELVPEDEAWVPQQEMHISWPDGPGNPSQDPGAAHQTQDLRPSNENDYLREMDSLKAKGAMYDTDKEMSLLDGDTSCLATCSTGDIEDDPLKSAYSYEAGDDMGDESGALTSCVGTRWYRAPELLYGSTNYGQEIDLWSLGCIFAELFNLEPLFPGVSDIDQLGRIIEVLGNLTEETYPGCSILPDYDKISFKKVHNPIGLQVRLPNRSASEVNIVKKLLHYSPANRATATEILHDSYFLDEPIPVPVTELTFPPTRDDDNESSPENWANLRDLGSDSDIDEFGSMDVSTTEKGFSIKFS